MKRLIVVLLASTLSICCNGQSSETKNAENKQNKETALEQPKGSWKVEKEFDERGNLIRYDSMYSWVSGNTFDNLSSTARDSLLESYKSRFFTNFSQFDKQGFDDIYSLDSLFSERFFTNDFFGSDFGTDFMDIERLRQRMLERQKTFLEKYRSVLSIPEDEN